MADRKLRLNLNALRVKSFETASVPGPNRGTVRGHEDSCTVCTDCSAITICPASCNANSGYNMSTSDDGYGC